MYDNEGFYGFQQLSADLQDPFIEHNRLLVVLYIAMQYAKFYLQRGEFFCIDHLISEMKNQLAIALSCQDAS